MNTLVKTVGAVKLRVTGLCFAYPDRPLFADWAADVRAGVTLVRGGDGCGKTTLLRLLAGDQAAGSGRLQLSGADLDEQAQAYRQMVFRTDPSSNALDQMTATDYFKAVQSNYAGFSKKWMDKLIDGLSLAPHLDKYLYMLSTGSKRKVWLAAAFASGAELTLLDEPFAALDKSSIQFVLELLANAAQQSSRAWVIADYVAPDNLALNAIIDLGD